MRRRQLVGAGLGFALVLAGATTTMAAPSPDTNKHALAITLDCGSQSIVGMTIRHNAAIALQIDGDQGAVAQIVELWSYTDEARTQGETLWFTVPGFGSNGSDALTCEWWNALYPDLYWSGAVVIRPTG